jgi:hypothetical protein
MDPMVCKEHGELSKLVVRMATLVEEKMLPSQDRMLHILEGANGNKGICDRVGSLEHDSTTTRDKMDRVVVLLEGEDGSGGFGGRMAKMERTFDRVWAMLIGVALAGGAAGIGIWKGIAALLGS